MGFIRWLLVAYSLPFLPRQNMISSDIDDVGKRCVAIFKQVYDLLGIPACPYTKEISSADINDELGRFKIWGRNIGAFQPKAMRSSLQYRLQDASRTRQHLLSILKDLQESLDESNSDVSSIKLIGS